MKSYSLWISMLAWMVMSAPNCPKKQDKLKSNAYHSKDTVVKKEVHTPKVPDPNELDSLKQIKTQQKNQNTTDPNKDEEGPKK